MLGQKELSSAIFVQPGSLPSLMTVPHDGTLRSLNGVDLSYNPHNGPRDVGVARLADRVSQHVSSSSEQILPLIIQQVHRKYLTPEIQDYFEQRVLSSLSYLLKVIQPPSKVFLLDLHGFTKQPDLGEAFDFVLGTGHRKTINGTNMDIAFSEFMIRRGYRVYLPTSTSIAGERYGAVNPRTLAQRVHSHGYTAMQVEISRSWRNRNHSLQERLGQDLGNFLISCLSI